jgi:hypothetical protein
VVRGDFYIGLDVEVNDSGSMPAKLNKQAIDVQTCILSVVKLVEIQLRQNGCMLEPNIG